MSDFPWLPVVGGVPLLGSLVVWSLPRSRELLAKRLALAFALLTLGVTIAMCAAFEPARGGGRAMTFQFSRSWEWIPSFGVRFALGVDGIALVLIALVAVLVPVVLLASWHEAAGGRRSVHTFFALVLLLETMLVGVFAATDVFVFYVFFEAMLVPMYFLIGSYGGPQRSYAAMKFLLYSLFGGLLMLAAVIGLYVVSAQHGTGTFDFAALARIEFTPGVEKLLFLGFFVAFAIKAPLVPFHTWLPDAGAEAPTGGSVLLVGVLDKVGTFGFIRYCIPLFPNATRYFAPLVLTLAVIGVLYGAFLAIGQRDLKRLVSYTSVAHFGFIGLGLFALTSQGQAGGVLYMVNHGLSTGLLFFVVGFLIARRRTRLMSDYSGVGAVAPLLAGSFLVAGLSALALPGLNAFVSEFLVLVGTFTRYRVAAILATLGIVLAALYILITYQRTMTGPVSGPNAGLRDLSAREMFVAAPMIALIVALGVYPKPVLDVITPAVDATMAQAGRTDPRPTVPAPTASPVAATSPGTGAR